MQTNRLALNDTVNKAEAMRRMWLYCTVNKLRTSQVTGSST